MIAFLAAVGHHYNDEQQTNKLHYINKISFIIILSWEFCYMTDGSKHKTVVWTKCVSNGAASQHFINFSSTFHWTVKRHDFDTTNQSCYAMLLPENSPFDSTVYKLTTPCLLIFSCHYFERQWWYIIKTPIDPSPKWLPKIQIGQY